MASVASQLLEEVTEHGQSDSLEDAREICADGTYFPNNLRIFIIVQQDSTQSSLFIILQIHSTYFGCQQHPSSGVQKIVTTASGTVEPPRFNVDKRWPRWKEVTAQKI